MSTTEIGRLAEDAAAKFLIKKKFSVLTNNWRTRWCEIDIVAKKNDTVYFVEVKYRQSNTWGDGLDAITAKKLQQMTFAAKMWVNQKKWNGNCELAVITASGDPVTIDDFIIV